MRYLLFWNFVVFSLYGIDKWKALCGKWRISEKALLVPAFLMGGFGAFFGMYFFRHKTRKTVFVTLVPTAMLMNIAVIYFIGRYFL